MNKRDIITLNILSLSLVSACKHKRSQHGEAHSFIAKSIGKCAQNKQRANIQMSCFTRTALPFSTTAVRENMKESKPFPLRAPTHFLSQTLRDFALIDLNY